MTITSTHIAEVLNAVSQLAMASFVGLGVLVAYKQLQAGRVEKAMLRRSEIAEEAISNAFAVEDALGSIRSPFDSIPEAEIKNKRYPYAKRYERIVEANHVFSQLRQSQIRVRAVIGDEKVDAALESLIRARNDVAVSIQILADYTDETHLSDEDRKHRIKLKRTMYGTGGDSDELGKSIKLAVATIEKHLTPVARLELQR